jgi:uncharacterized protein
MRGKRVILDTNLWISFLISKQFNILDNLLLSGKIKLIFSTESIEEFLAVTKRAKFKKFFSDENIEELLRLFDKYGKLIDVSSKISECRDYKDNFLLNLAVDSNADFLITGDHDLLIIGKIKNTKIMSWADFIHEIK